MFAVLKTGGKQYRVATGDTFRVEKLAAEPGEMIQFNDVLMVDGTVGTPFVDGAAVQAEVIDQIRGDKVIHYVRRRRKHSSKRTKGHRQYLTVVRVTEILASGGDATGVRAAIGAGAAPKIAASPATAAPVAAAARPAAESPSEGSGARPANLLEAPRGGAADDLSRISGVGPKLVKLLNDAGVFHFDQIAAWNDDEIAYMDEDMSLRGRITRDDWAAQAKQLAADAKTEE